MADNPPRVFHSSLYHHPIQKQDEDSGGGKERGVKDKIYVVQHHIQSRRKNFLFQNFTHASSKAGMTKQMTCKTNTTISF